MWRIFALAIALMCILNCAIGPERTTSKGTLSDPAQTEVNELNRRPSVGIALAGGGTKAASYAMGVLSAVADTQDGFKQIGAISSVSGGSYSAFYLYSKLLAREGESKERERPVADYFDDCIPHIYKDVLPTLDSSGPKMCGDGNYHKYPFQQFARCRQDIFENDCKQQLNSKNYSEYAAAGANSTMLLALSLMASVPNFITCSLFDWPINLSPSRYAYMEGIGTAYGLYPRKSVSSTTNIVTACDNETFLNCEMYSDTARLRRKGLNFEHLRDLTQRDLTVPVWYINATTAPDRSVAGWAQEGKRNFQKYTMQMSPFWARSGLFGDVPDYNENLDLLDAVTASAAFLDSNERILKQPARMALAIAQHLFALDWGFDIPNPNVYQRWRFLHNVAPVPFYWFDSPFRERLLGAEEDQKSAYIRLMDGGNNDNLGAYTLIQAGIKEIIISDHAQDRKPGNNNEDLASMEDLCYLHNEIAQRSGGKQKLVIPGLKDFDRHCLRLVKESECGQVTKGQPCETIPNVYGEALSAGGYSINDWKYPVLLGYIKAENSSDDIRVYVLKPAFDRSYFKNEYLQDYTERDEHKLKVSAKACSAENPWLCELASFIANMHNNKEHGFWHRFPQDETIVMTFASSGKLYGAYRELGRWQMHEALKIMQSKKFYLELSKQSECPLERKKLKNIF